MKMLFMVVLLIIIVIILISGVVATNIGATATAIMTSTIGTTPNIDDMATNNIQNTAKKECIPVNKCSPNGSCDEFGGCNCKFEWEGPTCNKKRFKCTKADCSNNGKPHPIWLPKGAEQKICTCDCNPGYTGKDCSISNCPNCIDLSKSRCSRNKTCIKNNREWVCIKGHYLDKGNGTPESMDCIKCPKGTKLLDSMYTGKNSLEHCKCMEQVEDVDGTLKNVQANAYLDVKKKKCVTCSESDWTINDGKTGKIIVAPKDDSGKKIKDWIVYDKTKQYPSGTSNDCKCNSTKHFHNSKIKEKNCVQCYPGAKLVKKDNIVEICQCQEPDWILGFGPPPNNPDGSDVPKCIQNSACINPHFSKDGSNKKLSNNYCANKTYFGYGVNEEWGDFIQNDRPSINMKIVKNYKDFADPESGQIKCRLLETPDMIKIREERQLEHQKTMGNKAREYLELAEKTNAVNSMIDTANKHITNKQYDKAEKILTEASMYAKGFEIIKKMKQEKIWKPYKFKSTDRIEVKEIPKARKWNAIKAIELMKTSLPARIIFSDDDIKSGNLVEGSTIRLNTKCGTNRMGSVIKIDRIRTGGNPGVIPIIGDNLESVEKEKIIGDDCSFERILNPLTETHPVEELMAENDKIKEILRNLTTLKEKEKGQQLEVERKKAERKEAARKQRIEKERIEAERKEAARKQRIEKERIEADFKI